MVKVLCTIWALVLNSAKIYLFQTCCENTFEDDEETITIEPSLPAFFFATGVYVILSQISLFPKSFQKPIAPILCAYEALIEINEHEAADWFEENHHMLMMITLFVVSIGFLLICLHITKVLNFSILTDYGIMAFLECAISNIWRRLQSELPKGQKSLLDCSAMNDGERRPRRPRRRRRPFKECHCSSES